MWALHDASQTDSRFVELMNTDIWTKNLFPDGKGPTTANNNENEHKSSTVIYRIWHRLKMNSSYWFGCVCVWRAVYCVCEWWIWKTSVGPQLSHTFTLSKCMWFLWFYNVIFQVVYRSLSQCLSTILLLLCFNSSYCLHSHLFLVFVPLFFLLHNLCQLFGTRTFIKDLHVVVHQTKICLLLLPLPFCSISIYIVQRKRFANFSSMPPPPSYIRI